MAMWKRKKQFTVDVYRIRQFATVVHFKWRILAWIFALVLNASVLHKTKKRP